MKTVVTIPDTKTTQKEIPLELTHRKMEGWRAVNPNLISKKLKHCKKVVYLGHCKQDGDMFAVYYGEFIEIWKGNLNSGKY